MEAYYLATPLFFLADVVMGLSVRVSALGNPGLRYLYYAFALGCGILARTRPRMAPFVGIAESSLNVLLLVLSIMLPVFQLPEQFLAGEGRHSAHFRPQAGQFRPVWDNPGGQLPPPPSGHSEPGHRAGL